MSTDLELDLVSKCRGKMAYLRLKELKDVLTQLGLAKYGKKQDLVDRILTLLSDDQGLNSPSIWRYCPGKEDVVKIIDDAFRKMYAPAATDLTSKPHSDTDLNNEKPKEKPFDSHQLEMKVQCSCGSSLMTNQMTQCEDPSCGLWQHTDCVIIPEKPIDGVSAQHPSQFYCEICRINRADPFWVTIGQPILPLKLTPGDSSESANIEQILERTFSLTREDRELLQKTEYDVQVWCLLLNDKVPFRMHWPQYAKLEINGIALRVVTRSDSQLLGINGRDDGPVITTCSMEGLNKITLTSCDARIFCFGVRLAKRMTLPQVLGLIPKEGEGELFDEALARVQRCVGGGAAAETADSDSDIEVVADSVTVNLRCPVSGSRIKIAGRFKPCVHMGCFDLETFVELTQRSRKWQCPICLKNYSLENIIIDPYFSSITSLLQICGEDVNEIDVKPDGSWRTKNGNGPTDLGNWHLPDGSLCGSYDVNVRPDLVIPSHIKDTLEGNGGFRIGIKRNRNGMWEVSKSDNNRFSSSGTPVLESNSPVEPMSINATGIYTDKNEVHVDQEDREQFNLPLHNDHEFDPFPQNKEPKHSFDDRRWPTAPSKDPDVIVLSDSDDDNITIISPGTVYGNSCPVGVSGTQSCIEAGFPEKYPEYPGRGTNASSSLGLFGNASDDFGMPIWGLPSQTDPGFQIFGSEEVVFDGFDLLANDVAETANVQDLSSYQLNTEMNEVLLVDNPLAFSSNDPSLQIFLPTCPAKPSLKADLNNHAEAQGNFDGWGSFSLAADGGHVEAPPSHAGDQGFDQFMCKEDGIGVFNDTALLLSAKDARKDGENASNHDI